MIREVDGQKLNDPGSDLFTFEEGELTSCCLHYERGDELCGHSPNELQRNTLTLKEGELELVYADGTYSNREVQTNYYRIVVEGVVDLFLVVTWQELGSWFDDCCSVVNIDELPGEVLSRVREAA